MVRSISCSWWALVDVDGTALVDVEGVEYKLVLSTLLTELKIKYLAMMLMSAHTVKFIVGVLLVNVCYMITIILILHKHRRTNPVYILNFMSLFVSINCFK